MNIFKVLIALLGALLIALPLLPPDVAGNFIFLSLGAVPLIVLQLIMCGVLWRKKGSHWRWIYIGLVAANIPLLLHYRPLMKGKATETEQSLKVISWNVTNFHIQQDTLEAAAAFIRKQSPHIICLQEVPHNNLLHWDSIRAAFPEYPYSYKNLRDDEVLNLGVLSKYPLADVHTYYFTHSYNKMASMYVATPQGTFRLWNVHLQTTGNPKQFIGNAKQRNRQAQLLKEKIKENPSPTLVCGDFNDTPSSYTYRTASSGMKDAYLKGSNRFTGSYQPLGDWLRIDYMFCTKHFGIVSYELIENPWSDHKMQIGILNL